MKSKTFSVLLILCFSSKKLFLSNCAAFEKKIQILGFHESYGIPTTRLIQGYVQGHYKKSYGGRTFSAFEGIPYAKPPVGDLRFKVTEK